MNSQNIFRIILLVVFSFGISASGMQLAILRIAPKSAVKKSSLMSRALMSSYRHGDLESVKDFFPPRLLQRAIQVYDLKTINSYREYAGCWFPDGSTPILDTLIYQKGKKQEDVIKLLLKNRANPLQPNLSNLSDPMSLSKFLRDVRKRGRLTGKFNFDRHYQQELAPIKTVTTLLLASNPEKIVHHLERYYAGLKFSKNHGQNRKQLLEELLHNSLMVAKAIIAPLLNHDQAENLDLLYCASLLAQHKLIKKHHNANMELDAAIEFAPALARRLTINAAKTVAALLTHGKIKLFSEQPLKAFLFTTEHNTEEPMFDLNILAAHEEARKIIENAVANL